MTSPSEAAKPQDAVLVFGSTGKLGRLVVKQVMHGIQHLPHEMNAVTDLYHRHPACNRHGCTEAC
jgi:hypothetical protein